MAKKETTSSINYVHQTAILCETIKKEQKNQKLYTNYSINPFKSSKFFFINLRNAVMMDDISGH